MFLHVTFSVRKKFHTQKWRLNFPLPNLRMVSLVSVHSLKLKTCHCAQEAILQHMHYRLCCCFSHESAESSSSLYPKHHSWTPLCYFLSALDPLLICFPPSPEQFFFALRHFFFFIYVCVCVSVWHMCVGAHRGHMRVSDPLELELKSLKSHRHGCWEPKSSLPEGQKVFLATGASLLLKRWL